MTDDVRISFAVPRHLAVGLDLVALADGCGRNEVLHRAVTRSVKEAGLWQSLERLASTRRRLPR
jgi:hypothetical protein